MFLFKKKPKSYLGIDLSASAIKLVELEKKEERYHLKNYAIYSLKDYYKEENQSKSFKFINLSNEEISEMIKEAINRSEIESRNVCFSIPVYSSFSTVINLPVMSKKEIDSSIPFEVEKYVPIPLSEIILDWSIIDPPSDVSEKKIEQKSLDSSKSKSKIDKEKPKQEILLIAVPKEIVNSYKNIVNLTGLKLGAVEEETFSLSRSLIGNDKVHTLLIDAGFRSINVSIIDNGYIKAIHNLEMGGIKINEVIAEQMNISTEEAEEIKIKFSNNELSDIQKNKLAESIKPVFYNIITEIKKIIDVYQIKHNKKIERCILTGGSFKFPGFADFLKSELAIDTFLGNPFARVTYNSLLEPVIKELGPLLSVAIGLAMREG